MNFSRPEQLHELESKSEFDLLIIGGGIVGSAALELSLIHISEPTRPY